LQPYLMIRTLAGIGMGIGHLAFVTLFVMNLAGWGRARSGGPTYFVEPEEVTTVPTPDALTPQPPLPGERGKELAAPVPTHT